MNLKQLECFCYLVETLSFTKAAEKAYMSQSAFSRSIASLENEVGDILIRRRKVNPQLTEVGEKIYEKARIILQQMEEIEDIARRNRMGTLQDFRIGVLWGGLFPIHKRILREYNHKYPEVVIEVNEYSEADILKELELGNIELAFFITHDNQGVEQFNAKKLARMRSGLICPSNHPLAQRKSVSVEELQQSPFIMMKPDKGPVVNTYVAELCVKHGFQPKISRYADSPFIMLDMIEEGFGVTILSEPILQLGNKNVTFVPVKDASYANQYLLWRKDNKNAELKRLTDYICQQLKIE